MSELQQLAGTEWVPVAIHHPQPATHFSLIFTTRFGSSRSPGFLVRSS